jgi:hypothetical protein
MGNRRLESYVEAVRQDGIQTNRNATFGVNGATPTVTFNGPVVFQSTTAVPAGGATTAGVTFSSTTGLGIYFGSGVPTLSAAQGSLYLRTDGSSTATRLYVNTNGTTGWTNFTSAT